MGRQRRSHARGNFHDAVPPLGRTHDAPDRGNFRIVEDLRDHAIGRHHELLDKRCSAILFLARKIHYLGAHGYRPGLDSFKIERSMLITAAEH